MFIDSKEQLIEALEKGCKPEKDWRIGTEHEKFLFNTATKKRIPYKGNPGIKDVLEKLASSTFAPIFEGKNIIGLKGEKGDTISLEPGGQLELSGAPLRNIHQTCEEISAHLRTIKKICTGLGVAAIGLGVDPISDVKTIPWMPKRRYQLMKKYMPTKGTLGTSMMTLTSTIQVNLDFKSEADMAKKMYVSAALQPLSTALFANSSIVKRTVTPFQSYRSYIWQHTDEERCGIPACILSKTMTFEHWVDYMLDVPMYFVYRNGTYYDVLGKSFRDFMKGNLQGFEGQMPTLDDWYDHLSTAFPEVRLKTFIEMRGADGGAWNTLCALPAFWVGLLYDDTALEATYDIVKKFTPHDILSMRDDVPTRGLKTQWGKKTFVELGKQILQIAQSGLTNRRILDAEGNMENIFLKPLHTILKTEKTPADILRETIQNTAEDIDNILMATKY